MDLYVPTTDGQWVSERFARLAEILRDYDPGLELCWIPPHKRKDPEDHTRAFAIVHNTPTSRYIALYASDRSKPEEILAQVFLGDRRRNDVISLLEANELAQDLINAKEEQEKREEAMDKVDFYARTPKHYLREKLDDGTKIKFDDKFRRV